MSDNWPFPVSIPPRVKCEHKDHKPPELHKVPVGSPYIHICPGCKKQVTFEVKESPL